MADVYISRFNRWFERLFNVKGGPTVLDVDSNVHMSFDYPIGNEDRFLQGWNRYGFAVTVGAVASNFGTVQLRNPASSNIVSVVESLTVNTPAANQDFPTLTWGATVTDLATVAALTFTRIDSRGNPQPTAIISSTTTTANLAIFAQLSIPAGSTGNFVPSINCEYTVLPGQILKVFSGVANQAFNMSILWRERALETSEFN